MSARTLKIPEEIINALRVPPDDVEAELYKELALALYQRGMLSSGKASALSGLTRLQFEDLLGQRKVNRHYGEAELEEDLKICRVQFSDSSTLIHLAKIGRLYLLFEFHKKILIAPAVWKEVVQEGPEMARLL